MRIVHPERKSDDIDTKRWKIRIIENNKWNIQLLMEQNREKCKKRKWNENSCKCNNDLKWKMLQLTWYHVKCHRFSFRLFHFKNSFLSQETWGCDTNTNLKIKKSHTFANRCENDYKCVDIKMYLTIVHLLELNNGTHIRCERKMKKKKTKFVPWRTMRNYQHAKHISFIETQVDCWFGMLRWGKNSQQNYFYRFSFASFHFIEIN